MGTLRASGGGGDKPHVLAPIPIDMRQASRGATMTNNRPEGSTGGAPGTGVGSPGDPAFTVSARGQAVAIAFSCKDHGADATEELAPTMRAMGHSGSHANAGGQLAVCVTGDITHTLRAEGFDAGEDGTGRGQPIVTEYQGPGFIHPRQTRNSQSSNQVGIKPDSPISDALTSEGPGAIYQQMAVRRLMPVECERLQGFPDGWTLVPVGKRQAADGPRYKQLGNSWAVPVVSWIGQRIDAHVKELESRTVEHDPLILWLLAP